MQSPGKKVGSPKRGVLFLPSHRVGFGIIDTFFWPGENLPTCVLFNIWLGLLSFELFFI